MSAGILVAAGVVLALAAGLATIRVVRGPSLLDRMVASDVLLTTVLIALAAVMVASRSADLLPVLLVLAGTAAFGTIAVARSVSRHDRAAGVAPSEPLATRPRDGGAP